MRPIRAETTIDAPREQVFDLLADLARRPAFTDHFQHDFRLQRLESEGVGAAARFRMHAPRSPMWMETLISDVERPHRLDERGRGGRLDRVPAFTVWELGAGVGDTTDLSVTFWTEPGNRLDRMREHLGAARWYRRQWRRAVERLKQLTEARSEVEPVAVAGGDRIPT
jgi:uncharacterized protein YndB with AHSA1/START domain